MPPGFLIPTALPPWLTEHHLYPMSPEQGCLRTSSPREAARPHSTRASWGGVGCQSKGRTHIPSDLCPGQQPPILIPGHWQHHAEDKLVLRVPMVLIPSLRQRDTASHPASHLLPAWSKHIAWKGRLEPLLSGHQVSQSEPSSSGTSAHISPRSWLILESGVSFKSARYGCLPVGRRAPCPRPWPKGLTGFTHMMQWVEGISQGQGSCLRQQGSEGEDPPQST